MTYLADAQHRAGAIADALETVEIVGRSDLLAKTLRAGPVRIES
jgi:hypothetical protein